MNNLNNFLEQSNANTINACGVGGDEMNCKCDCCGKFRKKEDCRLQEHVCGDGFELDQYLECRFCMSESDLEQYGFNSHLRALTADPNRLHKEENEMQTISLAIGYAELIMSVYFVGLWMGGL